MASLITRFYSASEEVVQQEMASAKPLSPLYTDNLESRVCLAVKDIFSMVFFPVGLYRLAHFLAGRLIFPVSALFGPASRDFHDGRSAFDLRGDWKIKRITVEVDGYLIDGAMLGRLSTLDQGRWVLLSDGNNACYEDKINDPYFKRMLSQLNSNALVFNYPGVGCSSGPLSRHATIKAYRTMLAFLEDKRGIGAKEIIGYGFSIGGGVQSEALRAHALKQDIKYVFVKDRTFASLVTLVNALSNRIIGFLLRILGWNMDSVEMSQQLGASEIVVQTTTTLTPHNIRGFMSRICDDGVITAGAALAKALLRDEPFPSEKTFIGIPEGHNEVLQTASVNYLVAEILGQLEERGHGAAVSR